MVKTMIAKQPLKCRNCTAPIKLGDAYRRDVVDMKVTGQPYHCQCPRAFKVGHGIGSL